MRKEIVFLSTIFALVLFSITGCVQRHSKEDIRRDLEAIWNNKDFEAADRLFAMDYVSHDPGREDLRGLDAAKQYVITVRTAFPDLHVTIDDIIVEGNKVAARWTWNGTHKGPYTIPTGEVIPATGKKVQFILMSFWVMKDGKFIESYSCADSLRFAQQLGLIQRKK